MNFSEALSLMKQGMAMCRQGWNGKNLSVSIYKPKGLTLTEQQMGANAYAKPHFRIWDRTAKMVDAWLPSSSDLLTDDWMVYRD